MRKIGLIELPFNQYEYNETCSLVPPVHGGHRTHFPYFRDERPHKG